MFARPMTRRRAILAGTGTLTLAFVGCPRGVVGAAAETAAEIARFTGGTATATGAIAIDIAEIVENGNAVPLAVAVESPMTPEDYVAEILVLADANPQPRVATFHFTPMSGRAEAATRIRLAATENVIVIARTSQGKFHTARKEVKVSIGGCGG
jgi:sulfur-oxidizing protein SoxY